MKTPPDTAAQRRSPTSGPTGKSRKSRKDLLLPLSILAAVILIACCLCVILFSMWYRIHFRGFTAALSESAYQAYQLDSLTAEQDGAQWSADKEVGYEIFEVLTRDTGRLCRAPEQAASLTVTYGDGAVLELWDREEVDQAFGIILRFTSAENEVWTYSNDQLSLSMMLNMVQN